MANIQPYDKTADKTSRPRGLPRRSSHSETGPSTALESSRAQRREAQTLFSFGRVGGEGGNPLGRACFRDSVRLLPKLYAIAELMCLLEMGRCLAPDAAVKTRPHHIRSLWNSLYQAGNSCSCPARLIGQTVASTRLPTYEISVFA